MAERRKRYMTNRSIQPDDADDIIITAQRDSRRLRNHIRGLYSFAVVLLGALGGHGYMTKTDSESIRRELDGQTKIISEQKDDIRRLQEDYRTCQKTLNLLLEQREPRDPRQRSGGRPMSSPDDVSGSATATVAASPALAAK